MAFVDSLRGSDNSRLEGDRYWLDEAAERTQGWIRYFCEKNRTRRMAEGYLLETDLHESGWTLGCFDSLYHAPVPGSQYLVGRTNSALNGEPMFRFQSGSICLPLCGSPAQAMDEKSAFAYLADRLKGLLEEDGFCNIRLEKIACYEVYDEYRRKGFLSNEICSSRTKTNNLLGFTIRFHVEW